MFYAPVTDSMKVSQGGGSAHEGEFIEVVEMKVDQCLQNMLHNTLEKSLGLIFGLLWFQQFKAAWNLACSLQSHNSSVTVVRLYRVVLWLISA